MSVEARLRHTLNPTAEHLYDHFAVEDKLAGVIGSARRRQKIQVATALVAAAAALTLMFAGGVQDLFLTADLPVHDPANPDGSERAETIEVDRIPEDADLRFDDGRGDEQLIAVPFGGRDSSSGITASEDPIMRSTKEESDAPRSEEAQPADQGPGSTEPNADVPGHSETKSYALSAAPAAGGTTPCDGTTNEGAGCVLFDVQRGERFLSLAIDDRAGTDVKVSVKFDTDGDGRSQGEWRWVCTETTSPLRLPQGTQTVLVEIHGGTCADGRTSQPTTGEIKAVFE